MSKRISEVECVYNTCIVEGKKYVTISTYGSSARQKGGSASQVIHVDEESAKKIIDILKKEWVIKVFDGLPNFLMVFRDGLHDFFHEFLMGKLDGLV